MISSLVRMRGLSSSYAPNETSAQIYDDETWLQGELLSNIAYGVELTLFAMCFGLLVRQTNRTNRKRQFVLLSFISTIFALGTIFMGAQAKFTQIAFVEQSRYPGGPGAFEGAMFSITSNEVSVACFVVGNWLMDAFLVWRFMVIYRGCGTVWVSMLVLLPCSMLLASIGLGITLLVQTSSSSPFQDVSISWAYYVMSLALNIIVTLLIVGRLFYYRHWVAKLAGSRHASSGYVNIAAMLIESASLYSIFAILLMIPFGLGNNLANVFLQTVSQVQTVSSLLIIFRVATGRAWTEQTSTDPLTVSTADTVRLTTLQFAQNGATSTVQDSQMSKPENDLPAPHDLLQRQEDLNV